ncbi:hypothetical protein B0H19DRAFT_1062907 [Mycena capillaripes]|nr:hypothetical protein B0H19DRAFT_1062907 [Mycena capillaripes]
MTCPTSPSFSHTSNPGGLAGQWLVCSKAGSTMDPFAPSAHIQLVAGPIPAGHRTCPAGNANSSSLQGTGSLTVVFAAAPFVSGWWEPSVNSGASAKFVGKVTSNAVSAEGLLGHVPAGGRNREPGGQVATGYGISGDERSLNDFRQTEKRNLIKRVMHMGIESDRYLVY